MNKKALSESDICDKYIRPAMLVAGWHALDQVYREFPLRAGRVVVRSNQSRRDASSVLRADYARQQGEAQALRDELKGILAKSLASAG
jgi:type I restriction enzyme R subunit